MTEPLRADLTVWRGDTLRQPFTILNTAGSAGEDLTAWTIRIRVTNRATGAEVFDQAPVPDTPSTGTFDFLLTETETQSLTRGQLYQYQVQTTDPIGDLVTQFYGYLVVTGDMPA